MFSLLHRYILKQFLVAFLSAIFVFIGIFVVIRLMEQLNNFIRIADRTPFYKFILYFIYEIPFTFLYLIPIAVIFSTSFVLGKFSSSSELAIFKNAGQHILYYMYPIILFVLFYCIALHFFNNTLIYKPYAEYNQLHREFRNKSDPKLRKARNITQFGGDHVLYIIKEFDPKKKRLFKGNVIYLNDDYSFRKLVTFSQAIYNKSRGKWVAEEVVEKDLMGQTYEIHDKKILDIKENQDTLAKIILKKKSFLLEKPKRQL